MGTFVTQLYYLYLLCQALFEDVYREGRRRKAVLLLGRLWGG
jgi:hypothetical protein